jgi:hypothetical protein
MRLGFHFSFVHHRRKRSAWAPLGAITVCHLYVDEVSLHACVSCLVDMSMGVHARLDYFVFRWESDWRELLQPFLATIAQDWSEKQKEAVARNNKKINGTTAWSAVRP